MAPDQKIKLLLVDDDHFLLNMYSTKFVKEEIDVSIAQNGAEALQRLKDGFVPNIMVLDIIMPTMDGLELLAEIRRLKLAPSAIVIMLTNESGGTQIDKAKDLNIAGYIVKATTIPSEVVTNVLSIYKNSNHPRA